MGLVNRSAHVALKIAQNGSAKDRAMTMMPKKLYRCRYRCWHRDRWQHLPIGAADRTERFGGDVEEAEANQTASNVGGEAFERNFSSKVKNSRHRPCRKSPLRIVLRLACEAQEVDIFEAGIGWRKPSPGLDSA